MKNDQQTLEVLAALLALSLRHKANLADDGKESNWELLGYFHEVPAVKLALSGIDKVPAELAGLTQEEIPELSQALSDILNAWGVSHRRQDITNEIVAAIVDAIPAFQEAYDHWLNILNLPPTAILA